MSDDKTTRDWLGFAKELTNICNRYNIGICATGDGPMFLVCQYGARTYAIKKSDRTGNNIELIFSYVEPEK